MTGRSERRLAAILAADIAGYSRHVECDEEATVDALRRHLDAVLPIIGDHGGRVVDTAGDGILAEFPSAVRATEAAVTIQNRMEELDADVRSADRLQFRIGVNLGDVIVDQGKLFGDGVNIAARLEQLAEPGGIWVSAKVAHEVENKLPFGLESMGEHRVKNITEPVSAYRVRFNGQPSRRLRLTQVAWLRSAVVGVPALLLIGGTVAWFSLSTPSPKAITPIEAHMPEANRSLVVLPFDNLSDNKEQGYIADGITEDLTTELARIPGLFVISRNAAFTYKGKSRRPAQIAKELGVRYIVEGSTRRAGGEMRLNAQLIDAATGGHVWAERFDGQWTDVFALQDKVVASIADALKLRLITGQGIALAAGGTKNPAAYDAYLRGLELYNRGTPEDFVKAFANYRQAVTLDPQFGLAHAELAWLYWDMDEVRAKALGLSWDEVSRRLYDSLDAAAKHPSTSYYQLISQLLLRERKSDEAIAAMQKSVALDPSDPLNFITLGTALIFNGQPVEGRAFLDAAMRVNPGWNDYLYYRAGLAAFGQGHFEEAAALLEKINLQSPVPWMKFYGLQVLMSAYAFLENSSKVAAASENLKVVLKQMNEGELNLLLTQQYFVFTHEADIKRLVDGLRKAGVPELPPDVALPSEDRLTGPEITSLILDRTLQGRKIKPEVEIYRRTSSPGGTITETVGSSSNTGTSWVQGNVICNAFPRKLTTCGAVFRNPVGRSELKNEFLSVYRVNQFEFSVVK
jgi:TolB-like protein/class 3 adenylate cyclase